MSIDTSDLVLSLKQTKTPEKDLESLVAALENADFACQARPGSSSTTLVFARLASKKYAGISKEDAVKAYEFGVTAANDQPTDRSRIVYSYLTSPKETGGAGVTPGLGSWKFIAAVMPVTSYLSTKALTATAKKDLTSPALNTKYHYSAYGSEVALYFEFLKYNITALLALSVFGAVAYFKSKNYSLTYSYINVLWSTVFVILWRRRERFLTSTWGISNSRAVNDYDASLTDQNESHKISSLTGKEQKVSRRFTKQLAFAPVALVFVAVLVSFQLGCFVLEIFLSEIYDGPLKSLLTLLPTILICAFVPILTIVYNIVADVFLAWEGHDNNSSRTESFVVKTFVLNFLTGYVPLLITAFIYLPFAHLIKPSLPAIQSTISNHIRSDRYMHKYLTKLKSQKDFIINQERLNAQLFYFVVTNQVIQLIMKYGLPLVLPRVIALVNTKILGKKEPKLVDKPEEKKWLGSVRTAVQLPEYNVNDDYRGLTLQFGYLAMFGPVWTLAPLVSAIFNIVTFKIDSLKLANGQYFRPSPPRRIDSIHPWDSALVALAWIGSIVSPVVTLFYRHGTKPPKPVGQFAFDKASVNVASTTCLMLTLFTSEHVFFLLYVLGSKLSTLFKYQVEIDNDVTESDIKLRRMEFSQRNNTKEAAGSSTDWKSSSIDEIKKQAKGTHMSDEASTATQSGYKAKADVTASKADLEELERKKARLEKQRRKLEEKRALEEKLALEAKKDAGDQVITVPTAQGSTQAIIDSDQHIPLTETEDVEHKSSGKVSESDNSGGASVSSKTEEASSEDAPSKGSKRKGLKKLLKRK